MERSNRKDFAALLAAMGIVSGGLNVSLPAHATPAAENPMYVAEKKAGSAKGSTDGACGKDACGTDSKGAAAAKALHSKKGATKSMKSTKSTTTKDAKRTEASDKSTAK